MDPEGGGIPWRQAVGRDVGLLRNRRPPPRSDPAAQTGANGKKRSSPEAGERPSRNDAKAVRSPSSSSEQLARTHNNVCPNFVKRKVCHPKLTLREKICGSPQSAPCPC